MQRSDQINCAKRLFHHIANHSTDMAAAFTYQPNTAYSSVDRHRAEVDQICRRYPLLIGFSSDFAEPGDFKAMSLAGVPVLVVRGQDGGLRAYLNMCSHRAAPVAAGCGKSARGFVCPFHGWVYDTEGKLARIPGEIGFKPLTKGDLGLKPLPVQERYGLVWLSLTPDAEFDIDDHLHELGRDFAAYGYESYVHYKTFEMTKKMNWKLVMDTFLENYHLRTLHKNTIGDAILSFTQLADPIGDNLRLIQARSSFEAMKDLPEPEWDFYKHTAIVYLLFPNTLFIHQSDHVEIWRSYPDPADPGSSTVYFDFYIPTPADTERTRQYWDKNINYGLAIVTEEDFVLGEQLQDAFNSNLKPSVIFGRNESGLIHYHAAFNRALGRAAASLVPGDAASAAA